MDTDTDQNSERSLFDDFGGHYSVFLDGIEVARFAPSPHWSQYAHSMEDTPGFTYTWVPR